MTTVAARLAPRTRPALVAEAIVVCGWVLAIYGGRAAMPMGFSGGAVGLWVAVVAATMLPSALPAARHVARNSLRRRRHRAVGQFVLGYLAVWAVFGLVALLVGGWLPGDQRMVLVGVLLLAAGWQLVPMKQQALRACHRTKRLPAGGWRADAGALRFGLHNGSACVGSCWCLMLVMSWAGGPMLLWAAAIGAGVFVEKTAEQPGQAARLGALVLVLVALFAAVQLPLG